MQGNSTEQKGCTKKTCTHKTKQIAHGGSHEWVAKKGKNVRRSFGKTVHKNIIRCGEEEGRGGGK